MAKARTKSKSGWGWLGATLLLILTKLKTVLLLGAKLIGPLFSMLISVLAYAWLLGKVGTAVGLVLMILIHELGHVWAAKRVGLPVTLPVFIPFVGALIMTKRNPRDAVTEAFVAYGGPLVGSLGALASYVLGVWLQLPLLIAIAYIGFVLNLFNLIPIHPLDGGRISTAISRWLWVVGLVAGVVVLYFMFNIILLIIWIFFAWNLYKKFVQQRKKEQVFARGFQLEIPIEHLIQYGAFIPGENHRAELSFTTFSSLDGEQHVELRWDSMGVKHTVKFNEQMIVLRAVITRVARLPQEQTEPERIVAYGALEGTPHINDKYYDVPPATRWKFGLAYGGLAVFLSLMIWTIHQGFTAGTW